MIEVTGFTQKGLEEIADTLSRVFWAMRWEYGAGVNGIPDPHVPNARELAQNLRDMQQRIVSGKALEIRGGRIEVRREASELGGTFIRFSIALADSEVEQSQRRLEELARA